ncbi:MAG TPA: hypothetical protein VNW97_22430 [Candidatus Saccharimonadales bacterium]|jgi:hypothetical protein|nr:hypothetical protein [Candidatus Saccharimonadales bacterium]
MEENQGHATNPIRKPSNILQILGPDLFVSFPAVRTESRVIWCNFELARSLGFAVPPSNQMSAELHEQLLSAFSYRALRPLKEATGKATMTRRPLQSREALVGRASVTLYADMYGGDGVAPCLGSARGAFFPYYNAFTKGIGYTPLYRHDDADDFAHAHGGLDMHEALTEAVMGEVNVNLFERKTTRILAIFDQGDSTVYPNGKLLPRAITIRVGDQLRPAHILAKARWTRRSRLEIFLAMTTESGQLVTHNHAAKAVPDLRATMMRIIDDHARMAALQIRWRVSHHFLSASNMRMDGGMLDLNTIRTNPRLPPVPPDHSIDTERAPYTDYVDRASRIVTIYGVLRATLSERRRRLLNAGPLNIRKEMDRAYLKHLRQQLLCATGLKIRMADRIAGEQPATAETLVGILMRMTQISNPAGIEDSKHTITDVAALDVFALLAAYPQSYFAATGKDYTTIVRRLLRPVYRGNPAQIAKKRARVQQLISEFIKAYHDLMEAGRPMAAECYGNLEVMRDSIRSRAAFENRPTDLLFVKPRRLALERAIARYRATGDAGLVSGEMGHQISGSLRYIDELLQRGESRLLNNSGHDSQGTESQVVESQILVIDGIRYAVRSWNGATQRRCLHVSTLTEPDNPLANMRYRYTLDGWATSNDIATHIEWESQTQPRIACEIVQRPCSFAALQGHFYDAAIKEDASHRKPERKRNYDKPEYQRGYVFATPDPVELAEMLKQYTVNHACSDLPR